jgi:hypothetical protein
VVLVDGIRWLGFLSLNWLEGLVRAPQRTVRSAPKGKIPEGEIEGDFVSLGAYIANQSVLARSCSLIRARHVELSREEGRSL